MSRIVEIEGKYYNLEPKNTSFLLTAQELKLLGIKNWYLMLEVKYPQFDIEDVDVLDPNLSADIIGKIHLESQTNVWYWLRTCAKIPAKGSPKPFDITLTRASCAATWCFVNNIDIILCQPRQTWKTTISILLIVHAFIYDLSNVDIPFMHKQEKEVMRNAGMFRDYIECLPNWMNPFFNKKRPGLKSMKYEEHNNSIIVLSSAEDEITAKDKLRGYTLFTSLIDEWEFIKFISATKAGAAPAAVSARKIAAETGARTCMIYLSTPGDPETSTGKEAIRIIQATPRFSERFYDLTKEEISHLFDGMTTLDEDGKPLPITSVYIEFSYKQLRLTEVWLRTQYMEALKSGKIVEYRRGVLLDRSRDASTALFNQEDIDYIKAHQRTPEYEILLVKKYVFYIYKHEVNHVALDAQYPYFDSEIPYLIGIDISGASSKSGKNDNTAIVVTHPYTLEIVAELESPYLGGSLELMRAIAELAIIIPKGIFCPETNNIGKAILEFVQASQLEHRFFHDPRLDISKNATYKESPDEKMRRLSIERGYIGTYVTPSVREQMFGLLKMYLIDYRHKITGRFVVRDILNLVKDKSGKIQADPSDEGAHDDVIMAYLHTIYILTYGYQLERFGIDKTLCTFDEGKRIVEDYENKLEEKQVNNMVPYNKPTLYEEQFLQDMTNTHRPEFDPSTGIDPYGYTKNQYINATPQELPRQSINRQSMEDDTMSKADMSFFYSANGFF